LGHRRAWLDFLIYLTFPVHGKVAISSSRVIGGSFWSL
jgi:hypothetical protein